ncbi:MAG: hypothetical protein K2M11_03740 [Paramuribaculum sp.]|nr:hypothetical protein [Paramuribaculum sp.]
MEDDYYKTIISNIDTIYSLMPEWSNDLLKEIADVIKAVHTKSIMLPDEIEEKYNCVRAEFCRQYPDLEI